MNREFYSTRSKRPFFAADVVKKSCSAILFLFWIFAGHTQDLHFSQWFQTPLNTNPANTGFIPEADYRIGANFRDQGAVIMTNPYRTFGIWGDAQLLRNQLPSGWLGVGGTIWRDAAGAGSLTSTKAYGSIAYHQMLGYEHLLSAGFSAGWNNKRIDPTNLIFPDQFLGDSYKKTNPTSAWNNTDFTNSLSYFDMQAGINYAYFPTNKIYINGGVSVWHLNRARESFFKADPPDYDSRLLMRWNGFVNASIKVDENWIINPMAYYSRVADRYELVGGLNVQYNLSENGEKQLIGGLYSRWGDAIVPMIGFEMNNIRFSFSYDATVSGLSQYNNTRGALEFSVLRNGFYDIYDGDRKQSLCPNFK